MAATDYAGVVKTLIRTYKYQGRRSGADILATMMTALVSQPYDLIVPVPPAVTRLRQRGFDHTWLLARRLSARIGIPAARPLVRHGTGRQVGLNRSQRMLVAQGFTAARPVQGHVLLIDDVVTTGATMRACAKVLKEAGAESVIGLAAARG